MPWLGELESLESTSAHWFAGPAAKHNQQTNQLENAQNDLEALSALHGHGQPKSPNMTKNMACMEALCAEQLETTHIYEHTI